MTAPLDTKLLAAQVKAGDKKAIAKVTSALKRHDGNRTRAAEALGIGLRELYKWADQAPALAQAMGLEATSTEAPPPATLLSIQIHARDRKAIARAESTLRRNHGDVSKAAEALGVSRAALYKWAEEVPELAKVMAEHARGRGAPATMLTYQGQDYRLGELAKKLGIGRSTLSMRLAAGKTVEEAVAMGAGAKPAGASPRKRSAKAAS